jgi:hypothetical protein
LHGAQRLELGELVEPATGVVLGEQADRRPVQDPLAPKSEAVGSLSRRPLAIHVAAAAPAASRADFITSSPWAAIALRVSNAGCRWARLNVSRLHRSAVDRGGAPA